ncbi:SdpI family protein [Tenacibaculum maritimum]|uniref:SdpI family protein n=1 Tax=Tenacibaculum maritimum TaxID=107401 RepID=UPI003876863A
METIFKSILTFDIAIFLSLILFYFIKKDTINPIMGYRTKRAMKNQKNWSFAQKYFSKNWLFSIPIILISQVPILFDKTMELEIPKSIMNYIIYTVNLIYVTEKKLKEMDEI